MKRLNVVLDDELHKKLKLTAIEKNITISEFVTRMLEEALAATDTQEKMEVK